MPFSLAQASVANRAGSISPVQTMSLTSKQLETALALPFGTAATFAAFRFFELIKEDVMALFKLTPADLTDPNWEASSHRGLAIVRARDEKAARAIAGKAFDVSTGFRPGRGLKVPPWTRSELVSAERIEDPRWEADGPYEVLYPSFDVDLEGKPQKAKR